MNPVQIAIPLLARQYKQVPYPVDLALMTTHIEVFATEGRYNFELVII